MLKEPRRRIRFLTREEAERLLEAFPEHLRAVVRFALATGCRMSEILQLDWTRVDFTRRVAWLEHGTTKNGDGRGIPLNRDALLALRSIQRQHEQWCFTYQGNRMRAGVQHESVHTSGLGLNSFGFTTYGTPGPVGT